MPTIQVRIDEKTKLGAKTVLKKLGLDINSAIQIFLKQVKARKGLPFLVLTENGFTPEQEARILKSASEAKDGKNVSKPMEGEEAVRFLRAL